MFKFYFNFNGKEEELELSMDELILKALIEEYEEKVKAHGKRDEERPTGQL